MFQQQAPQLSTLLIAVGGGGLIAGISAWYEGRTKQWMRRQAELPRSP